MTEEEFRALRPGDRIRLRDTTGPDFTVVAQGARGPEIMGPLGQSPAVFPSAWEVATPARLPVLPGYESLARVLDDALAQAQSGKGHDRHATGQPFDEQPIVAICELLGSPEFAIGQAIKKAQEALRLPYPRNVHELLGAINYYAAAVRFYERRAKESP